jgi:hypothetical protein
MKERRRVLSVLALATALVLVAGISVQPAPGVAQAQEGANLEPAAPEVYTPAGLRITYQGYLMDGGSPANGYYDFFVSLYADAAATQWVMDASTLEDVLVTDGLFTLEPNISSGLFGDIHFYLNGEARYLRLGVRPGASVGAFTFLVPLQPLTPAPYAQALPGLHTIQNNESPNVVGGYPWNEVGLGIVGATISGGGKELARNSVYGDYATVGGGRINRAEDDDATVAGGASNRAVSNDATVGGGEGNTAEGPCAVVAGGCGNVTNAASATVGGGDVNYAYSNRATIGGGGGNSASGVATTIGGGRDNSTGADYTTVGGGDHNEVTAIYGTVGGGGGATDPEGNRVTDNWGTIGGGYQNHAGNANMNPLDAHYATIGGGYGNIASNVYATVGGGEWCEATGIFSTVGGGQHNVATQSTATVAGGSLNEANGLSSAVGGGMGGVASGMFSTISGGRHNEVTADYGTISGGGGPNNADRNQVTGVYGTVSGGSTNHATGSYATVPGGYDNTAQGSYSFAAGRQAKANYTGCFVWGDNSTTNDVGCYGNNRTVFRNAGGIFIYTNAALTSGVYLTAGDSSWNSYSDRAAKENFAAVDAGLLLARLAEIPVLTWNYKAQDPAIRHVGPMAQDFNSLMDDLGGEGEKYIDSLDADGVALAAIQGLYQLSQDQAGRIDQLETQNADLETRLAALEKRVGAAGSWSFSGAPAWLLLGGLVVVAGVVVQRRRPGGGA